MDRDRRSEGTGGLIGGWWVGLTTMRFVFLIISSVSHISPSSTWFVSLPLDLIPEFPTQKWYTTNFYQQNIIDNTFPNLF